jgi:hypothetical protein
VGDQLTNIAYIHAMRNDFAEALKWYREALPLYEKSQNNEKAETTRRNILSTESALGGRRSRDDASGSAP